MWWLYDAERDIVHFKIVVRNSAGWAGIGLAANRNLSHGFDMIVGGQYPNGTAFIMVSFMSPMAL